MGLDDLVGKAKDMLPDDAKIDSIAESIKDKTPDQIDGFVDKVADKAKDLNAEESAPPA
jgi:hypothetical protein